MGRSIQTLLFLCPLSGKRKVDPPLPERITHEQPETTPYANEIFGTMSIHPNSVIHPDAVLGDKITIGPFSFIDENVEIGEGTWIGPNVSVMSGARIGKNCLIFPGAVVAGIPQDLKFDGEETTAEIGDNTTLRENVTVNRGTRSKGKTVIGKNCLLMANAHVGHDCVVGDNCIIGNNVGVAGEVIIYEWAIISGMCGIHQFSTIGAHSFTSGLSKVQKDVPPFVKAARDPLSYAGLNIVGLKRRGFTTGQINAIHEIYRVIFQSGKITSEALKYIEANFDQTPERDEIIHFVRASKRGIIKGYKGNAEEEE